MWRRMIWVRLRVIFMVVRLVRSDIMARGIIITCIIITVLPSAILIGLMVIVSVGGARIVVIAGKFESAG